MLNTTIEGNLQTLLGVYIDCKDNGSIHLT